MVELYRQRVDEIKSERDEALKIGMKLREKNEMMNDIMKLAVEEQ